MVWRPRSVPGISSSYGEYSSATPAGVFAITSAFGRQPDPGAGLPYLRVDNSDWWVSDVNSPDYNTHQRCARGTCPFNESKSENLGEQGAVYDYALVMGVNAQRVPGGGSAFFVHVTNGAATAGCVAIAASTLVSILRWVRPGTVIVLSAHDWRKATPALPTYSGGLPGPARPWPSRPGG